MSPGAAEAVYDGIDNDCDAATADDDLDGDGYGIDGDCDDADASVARAVAAGAKNTMPVTEMFWGARYGVVLDPFGHSWSVATQVKALSHDEIQAGLQAAMREPIAKAG